MRALIRRLTEKVSFLKGKGDRVKLSKIIIVSFVCLALLIMFVLVRPNRSPKSYRLPEGTRIDISFDVEFPIEIKLMYEAGEENPAHTKTISSDQLKQRLREIFRNAEIEENRIKLTPYAIIEFTDSEEQKKTLSIYDYGDERLHFTTPSRLQCYCGKESFVAFHEILEKLFPDVDIPDYSKW